MLRKFFRHINAVNNLLLLFIMKYKQIAHKIDTNYARPFACNKQYHINIRNNNEVIRVLITRDCAIQTNPYPEDPQFNYSFYHIGHEKMQTPSQAPYTKFTRFNSLTRKRLISLFKKHKRSANEILNHNNSRSQFVPYDNKSTEKIYNYPIKEKAIDKALVQVCQRMKAKHEYSRSFFHSNTQTASIRTDYGLRIRPISNIYYK